MEEQGLIVVKDNFLTRVTQSIRRFFLRGKMEDVLEETNRNGINFIECHNTEFVQKEILDARKAFRKYVINNTQNISANILSAIAQKLEENEDKISKIIEINEDDISYHEISEMVIEEKNYISKFKKKNAKTGRYSVPIGVIGAECEGARDSIANMLKAISTRNAIIVLHKNFNEYSTEALIMLIIKDCLKGCRIDDNIIQMYEYEEIDVSKLNKLISKDGVSNNKNTKKFIGLYLENEDYEEQIESEIERIQNSELYNSYEIRAIKGDFGSVVNYLTNNKASAVCMYTNNPQKAYKFINWIDSSNVFVNTGIKAFKEVRINNDYFNLKYILHEGIF
jgi:hypothetical protein